MKVTEAKFTKRYRTGDYEHEEYALTAVGEEDSGAEVLMKLKSEVEQAHSGEAVATEAAAEPVKEPKNKKPKKEKKEKQNERSNDISEDEDVSDEDPAEQDSGSDDEGSEDDEATDSEADSDTDDNADEDASGDDEESEEGDEQEDDPKPAKAASKKEGTKKGLRKKPQTYNRNIEQHKEIFSGILRSIAPGWNKTDAGKIKGREISSKMSNKEFLDENGEVVPEFKAEVKKLFGKAVGKK